MTQTKMKPRAVGTAGASIDQATFTQRLPDKPNAAAKQDLIRWLVSRRYMFDADVAAEFVDLLWEGEQ